MNHPNTYVYNAPFKERYSENERKKKSGIILQRSSIHLPVIVENSNSSRLHLNNTEYQPPLNQTVNEFIIDIRRQSGIPHNIDFNLYINNVKVPRTKKITELYQKFKDPDGFLYLKQSTEYTWGKFVNTRLF